MALNEFRNYAGIYNLQGNSCKIGLHLYLNKKDHLEVSPYYQRFLGHQSLNLLPRRKPTRNSCDPLLTVFNLEVVIS